MCISKFVSFAGGGQEKNRLWADAAGKHMGATLWAGVPRKVHDGDVGARGLLGLHLDLFMIVLSFFLLGCDEEDHGEVQRRNKKINNTRHGLWRRAVSLV